MKINLIEALEETAEKFAGKVALVDDSSSLTFSALQKEAQSLSSCIFNQIKVNNRPVAVFLPKSNKAVVAFLAVLYSGNCYAPLDTKNPINRIKTILQVLCPSCIVTDSENMGLLRSCALEFPIINVDEYDRSSEFQPDSMYLRCIDTDPAYVMHTSGSTGIPKGVVISHRSIFDYIYWLIETFDLTEKEIIGNQAPFVFDNSTLDIFLMLFTGASLHIIPDQLYIFPTELVAYLNENEINFIFWVPSVLVNIANLKGLDDAQLGHIKKVLFCGEVMPTKHLNYWIKNLEKGVVFANLYGPTEITDACAFYIVDRTFADHDVLPIGRPCRNTSILILNKDDKLCEKGETGELCVRGSSLSSGYWNNPEKTNAAFTQNPLNAHYPETIYRTGDMVYLNEYGEIMFVGRKDFQIKHLGYRIELGEIEHIILQTFNSIYVCVVYNHEKDEIVAVYEAPEEYTTKHFRLKLHSLLPHYMMPRKFIRVEKLPKNASGKIDRSLLSKTYASSS